MEQENGEFHVNYAATALDHAAAIVQLNRTFVRQAITLPMQFTIDDIYQIMSPQAFNLGKALLSSGDVCFVNNCTDGTCFCSSDLLILRVTSDNLFCFRAQ